MIDNIERWRASETTDYGGFWVTDWQMFFVVVVGTAVGVSMAHSLAGIRGSLERIERKLEQIEDARKSLDQSVSQLHRIGTLLDAMWSPLKGINNALWRGKGSKDD